jgi:hypothetical protein
MAAPAASATLVEDEDDAPVVARRAGGGAGAAAARASDSGSESGGSGSSDGAPMGRERILSRSATPTCGEGARPKMRTSRGPPCAAQVDRIWAARGPPLRTRIAPLCINGSKGCIFRNVAAARCADVRSSAMRGRLASRGSAALLHRLAAGTEALGESGAATREVQRPCSDIRPPFPLFMVGSIA